MSGSRIVAIVIIVLVAGAIAGHFMRSSEKSIVEQQKPQTSKVTPAPVLQESPQKNPPGSSTAPPVYKTEDVVIPSPEKKQHLAKSTATARLAIIVDDMGSSLAEARELASINVPLTFAVIPGLRADRVVADFASANNIEILIHIPMQSKGWPGKRLESNGLLVSMESDELQGRVNGFIQKIPGAVGANNHMGSEFTEQEGKMVAVLKSLQKNNLFFVDSITSPKSTGVKVAKDLGMRNARRNVFLDNEEDRDYILGQLAQAVQLARKTGTAIAICHPHKATIAALVSALPGLSGQGVSLVPVSQLVQ